jgi:hypothetical protein
MQVLNRHNLQSWPKGAVYIGRGTALGNPYSIPEHGDRDAVCDQYEAWLDFKISQGDPVVITALLGLNADSNLVCSCAPARCHGSGIVKAWERMQTSSPIIHRSTTLAYAGIGSRKTPPDQLARMKVAAQRLAGMGFTLRSGGADGADTAFESGAGEKKEIFLPWRGFNGRDSVFFEPSRDAQNVAAALHPAWDKLSPAAKKLMARNSHQVLSASLKNPVQFVACWTPDGCSHESERGFDTGGTGQAIALASRWGIPVFNFARPDAGERMRDFLAVLKRDGEIQKGETKCLN